jgi:hypothetical protein
VQWDYFSECVVERYRIETMLDVMVMNGRGDEAGRERALAPE